MLVGWLMVCGLAAALAVPAAAARQAPSVNTWLVLGPFTARGEEAAEVVAAAPRVGLQTAGKSWGYFDDRLFSRNYDDYQDLFSYFRHRTAAPYPPAGGIAAYAHAYVHSARGQEVEVRLGADRQYRLWLNGEAVSANEASPSGREAVTVRVRLAAGWNRLLLRVANPAEGRLGFYLRVADEKGNEPAGLTWSVEGGGKLRVVTQAMEGTDSLPAAWREWPYVEARATDVVRGEHPRRPDLAVSASAFRLSAAGGKPPYRWKLAEGRLPAGLRLERDGRITGTVTATARLGQHLLAVQVADGSGVTARRWLTLTTRERPSRWYEQARLVALVHRPESMAGDDFRQLADTMRRQGYRLGFAISYNNGEHAYRWPSRFDPENPWGDVVGAFRQAMHAAGLKFGMYIGNFDGQNHGGEDGALLVVEEVMRRYRPDAIWFDWAGWDACGPDALYSLVRTINPETLIVLNGIPTASNGDWDVIVLEGWGAWGGRSWDLWPFPVSWPKRPVVETWRMLADPTFEYSKGVTSDWQEYLRLQISIICEGYVANIDHSPSIGAVPPRLGESHVYQCHQQMAAWASPAGKPPRYPSYTGVNPGPLPPAGWGYNVISADRRTIYLHLLRNERGKTGLPAGRELVVGPLAVAVRAVRWVNGDNPLAWRMKGKDVAISLAGVEADPIDTIIEMRLAKPYQGELPSYAPGGAHYGQGNLAHGKPARLLSADGSHLLPASAFHFAQYGVDGLAYTSAQGGNEWAWTYEVDLEKVQPVERVAVSFGVGCWATEYAVLLSVDGREWTEIAHVQGCDGKPQEHRLTVTAARWVRVRAIKPDGPGQPGAQMSIAELIVEGPAQRPGSAM